jgi:hypothetical protein
VSVVRVGATKKFSENWDSIFSKGSKKSVKKGARPAVSAKKAAGKKAKKKK